MNDIGCYDIDIDLEDDNDVPVLYSFCCWHCDKWCLSEQPLWSMKVWFCTFCGTPHETNMLSDTQQ